VESNGNLVGGPGKGDEGLRRGGFNLVTGGTLLAAPDQCVSSWCRDKSN
jgi:hypothetical protein